jgi:hypothetical protein
LLRHLVLDGGDLLFCGMKGLFESIHLPGCLLLVNEVLVKDFDPGTIDQPGLADNDPGETAMPRSFLTFSFCDRLILLHQTSVRKADSGFHQGFRILSDRSHSNSVPLGQARVRMDEDARSVHLMVVPS